MRPLPTVLALLALLHFPLAAGTPKQAEGVRTAYEASVKAWVLKMQLATTPEARAAEAADRPDAVVAARRMWSVIQPNLSETWTLPHAAWLLRMSPALVEVDENGVRKPAIAPAVEAIFQSIETRHLKSAELAPICLALAAANQPKSLGLLEKIEKENPDKRVQGVAALGIAMMLKELSDEPEVMARRLTMLRKAIIESSDMEIEGASVAKLAEDELYIIRFLSKGREAPDLSGTGSGGEPMTLSSYRGKVVVLLFWTARSEDHDAVVAMVDQMRVRFSGQPFEVVGVNADPRETLRKMQASGEIKWPNFSDPEGKLATEYRVGFRPLAYVLDGQRKIHYVGQMGSFVELTAAAVLQEGR